MTMTNVRFNTVSVSDLPDHSAQNLGQLQDELALTARMWAVEEIGAAIAHRLSGPLTVLLVYLHEIRSGYTDVAPATCSTRELLERALRETERVCDIIQQMGHTFEGPADNETAIARGRQAIDALGRRSNADSLRHEPPRRSLALRHLLTARERQVLDMIIGGASNKEGGYKLGISTRTFEVHRAHIMEKLGARNAADLVRMTMGEAG